MDSNPALDFQLVSTLFKVAEIVVIPAALVGVGLLCRRVVRLS